MSDSLDPGETPSYSTSHPDPSYLHMALLLCLAANRGSLLNYFSSPCDLLGIPEPYLAFALTA